jgi:type I restriction enzyme S subunit
MDLTPTAETTATPQGWQQLPLVKLAAKQANATVGGPFGSDLVAKDYVGSGVPVIRGQNMGRRYVSGDFAFVTPAKAKALQANLARPFDLVFTQRGTVGQVALVPPVPFDEYLISQSQMKLTVDMEAADPGYLYQYFASEFGQKQILDSAIQTGVPHTNLGILRSYLVPLPQLLEEQRSIASALFDADALIDSLEQLLTKKRQIKQGAIQELLTGQQRLPGFGDQWNRRSMADLFDFSGGLSASRDQLGDVGLCYLHYGDIHLSNKTYINFDTEHHNMPRLDVDLRRVATSALLRNGDVVFVDASEDDRGVSKHVVIHSEEDRPLISGLHTIVARPKSDELVDMYKRYCFQAPAVHAKFRFYAVGTKVSGVSKGNIGKIFLNIPSPAEQTEIAACLCGLDAEIDVLESRLTKARGLKQAISQALLTGRIRLVEPTA